MCPNILIDEYKPVVAKTINGNTCYDTAYGRLFLNDISLKQFVGPLNELFIIPKNIFLADNDWDGDIKTQERPNDDNKTNIEEIAFLNEFEFDNKVIYITSDNLLISSYSTIENLVIFFNSDSSEKITLKPRALPCSFQIICNPGCYMQLLLKGQYNQFNVFNQEAFFEIKYDESNKILQVEIDGGIKTYDNISYDDISNIQIIFQY